MKWLASIALLLAVSLAAANESSVDKGDFVYAEPPALAVSEVDPAQLARLLGRQAATRCGRGLAAAPLSFGPKDVFAPEPEARSAGAKLFGAVVGGRAGRGKPSLQKDPIGKRGRERFRHWIASEQLAIGGEQGNDSLLISLRVDKSKSKSTFHSVFLERSDCTRLWPDSLEPYGVWGDWKLSVAITKTTERYRNGRLIDRQSTRENWQRSGELGGFAQFSVVSDLDDVAAGPGKWLFDPSAAYSAHLLRQNSMPAWREMGYGEPTGGIRTMGARFDLRSGDLGEDVIAVVHLTDVGKSGYRTTGFAFRVQVGPDGALNFSQLPPPGAAIDAAP